MSSAISFGFGIGIGFFLSLIAIILFLKLLKKAFAPRPTVAMWKDYLQKQLEEQDFKEVAFVKKLILGKDDTDTTPLPKGYKIKEKSELITNEQDDGSMSLRTEKERWIIKVKPRKNKSHE